MLGALRGAAPEDAGGCDVTAVRVVCRPTAFYDFVDNRETHATR